MSETHTTLAPWEQEIGLSRQLYISDEEALESFASLPEWSAFSIWLGEWAHAFNDRSHNLVALALLPSTEVVAPLASFGALIDSVALPSSIPSWSSFESMTSGKIVYLIPPKKNSSCKAEINEMYMRDNQAFRKVTVLEGPKNIREAILYISEEYFTSYSIRLVPHLSKRRKWKTGKSLGFMDLLLPAGDIDWTESDAIEAYVITSPSVWEEICPTTYLRTDDMGTCISLKDILLYNQSSGGAPTKIMTASSRSTTHPKKPALTIFDGLKSAYSWESIHAKNMLFLMSFSDWSEEAYNLLQPLFNWADNQINIPAPIISTPQGVELFYTAVPANEE